MRSLTSRIDIILADGGSSDGALTPDFLAGYGVRALLTKRGPGRLSAQMRMALAYALERGYEGIVVMDGNNKDDPSAVPAFAQLLDGRLRSRPGIALRLRRQGDQHAVFAAFGREVFARAAAQPRRRFPLHRYDQWFPRLQPASAARRARCSVPRGVQRLRTALLLGHPGGTAGISRLRDAGDARLSAGKTTDENSRPTRQSVDSANPLVRVSPSLRSTANQRTNHRVTENTEKRKKRNNTKRIN